MVSFDKGGGGPDGEPVGVPASCCQYTELRICTKHLLGLCEAALRAIVRRGSLLQTGGRAVRVLNSILNIACLARNIRHNEWHRPNICYFCFTITSSKLWRTCGAPIPAKERNICYSESKSGSKHDFMMLVRSARHLLCTPTQLRHSQLEAQRYRGPTAECDRFTTAGSVSLGSRGLIWHSTQKPWGILYEGKIQMAVQRA